MSPDDIRQQIELSVVELIKAKLADGSMTEERAQGISQVILDNLKPGMSLEELYKVVPKLDDRFQELAPVVLPYIRDYEKRIVKDAQNKVQHFIKQGAFDAAVDLAQRAVKQEVKLEWVGAGKPHNE